MTVDANTKPVHRHRIQENIQLNVEEFTLRDVGESSCIYYVSLEINANTTTPLDFDASLL